MCNIHIAIRQQNLNYTELKGKVKGKLHLNKRNRDMFRWKIKMRFSGKLQT